jgi:hypothetical protein
MGQKYNEAIRKYKAAAETLKTLKTVAKLIGTAAVGAAGYKTYEALK